MTKKYKELNKGLIQLGEVLPFDVLIYINDERSPLLFRKFELVEVDDLQRMAKYPDGRLIVLKDDYENFVRDGAIAFVKGARDLSDQEFRTKSEFLLTDVFGGVKCENSEELLTDVVNRSRGHIATILQGSDKSKVNTVVELLKQEPNQEDLMQYYYLSMLSFGGLIALAHEEVNVQVLENYVLSCTHYFESILYLTDQKTSIAGSLDKLNLKIDINRNKQAITAAVTEMVYKGTPQTMENAEYLAKIYYIMDKGKDTAKNSKHIFLGKVTRELQALQLPPSLVMSPLTGNAYIITKVLILSALITSRLRSLKDANNSDPKEILKQSVETLDQVVYCDKKEPVYYDKKLADNFLASVT